MHHRESRRLSDPFSAADRAILPAGGWSSDFDAIGVVYSSRVVSPNRLAALKAQNLGKPSCSASKKRPVIPAAASIFNLSLDVETFFHCRS